MLLFIFLTIFVIFGAEVEGQNLDDFIVVTGLTKSFDDAEAYCKTNKMNLVRGESSKILDYLISKKVNNFWIDVRLSASSAKLLHGDSTDIKSTLWASGEPQKCVVASDDKKWRSISCATLSPVVCTKEFFYIGKYVYEDAYQECLKYGYNLVRADTQASATALLEFAKSSKLSYYWIDGNDIVKEGTWVHHDGTPSANNLWGYDPASKIQEPNDFIFTGDQQQDCAIGKWIPSHEWRWADYICNEKIETICHL